jgi:DNA modification methylase
VTPFVQDVDFTLYVGDAVEVLRELPDESVHCCVTSPPYLGLRDYAADGQIGLESTIEEYVAVMVKVFGEVRRVMREDATLWLNLGDSYNAYNGGAGPGSKLSRIQTAARPRLSTGFGLQQKELKPKDLMGVPWRVALALQADGWYLRSDIIWAKPNPMPESVTDRPTKAHEYVFLLTRSPRYFFDQEAVREKYQPSSLERERYGHSNAYGSQFAGSPTDTRSGKVLAPGEINSKARGPDGRKNTRALGKENSAQHRDGERWPNGGRNIRSVWEIATQPYAEAHFATFPKALPERCIKAGCPDGGTVLDPFMGSGTTALVARRLGRKSVGIELNPEYAKLCARRLQQLSLFGGQAA